MVAFSAAGLVARLGRRASGAKVARSPTARGLIRVAAYLGALVFYAGSLEFLGFIVATAITHHLHPALRRALFLAARRWR